ncbi:MAG: hypothetical protein KGZ35_04430 [Truepera sp.]|nr:hypothetical protein [Truepera sp.]
MGATALVATLLLLVPLTAPQRGLEFTIPAERYTMRYVAPPPGITFMIRTYEPSADRHYFIKTVLPPNSYEVPRADQLHPRLAPPR